VPRAPACPICRRPAAPRGENPAFPFCSERCKLVDLGRWLGEQYRVPGERPGDGAAPPAPPADEEEP
jgi:endogenous inhibitor of DNA gyrase (YacG/DUF329 family)